MSPRPLARLRARAGVGAGTPRLTAVMPVHDVERWLPETLDSIASQHFVDHELLVVDDGSTDGTADVVRRRARLDRRIRLVQQANAGQSAARNRAVAEARGELLTFVDGDDLLPPDAWSSMVGSLDASGSDFAVGALERLDERGERFMTERMRANHAVLRRGMRVRDRPEVLADVFPVNKVYRTAFWRSLGLEFPTGMVYEDQPVLTRAFLAGTFDLLPETVYLYRIRSDHSSSTQLRHTMKDLQDRVESKRMTVRSVRADGDAEVLRVLVEHVLPVDLWEYFRSAPAADAAYWALLVALVRELWNDDSVPFWQTDVPTRQRLMGWLVTHDRRDDLERFLGLLDAGEVPVVDTPEGRVLDHPWRHEPGVPPECVLVRQD